MPSSWRRGDRPLQNVSNSIVYGDVIQVIGDGPVPEQRGRYFTAPRLGPSVVSRPRATATVASALAGAAPGAVIALAGNGGLGKTTLAAAVCHHDAVAARFAGGVLWVRLGQQRSGSALADAINAVSFEVTGKKPEITDPEQAGQHLGGVIAEDTLFVLDDVWSSEQISPFTLASSVTLLVTTRNVTALPNGAAILRAEPMTADEATAVLSQGIDAADPRLLAELAERCGGLPLLLALVGRAMEGYVRHGASFAEAAAKAREQLRDEGAAAFDQTADRASKHVAAMITSSLAFLEQEYGPETSRWYQELGIFPDGTDVPVSVLARYWSSAPSAAALSAREAERLCLLFVQHSLFEEYSVSAGTIRLHDVALSYLRQRMRPAQLRGLNERLLRSHLASPADDLADADWAAAAGREGYLWQYLGHHMRLAGHQNDWAAVAAGPRWVIAKLSASGPVALHADLEGLTGGDAALLRRAIVQSSHLLGEAGLRESLAATLISRFPPTEEYRALGAGIAENITGHWLQPVWPLPDRPPAELRAVLAPADPRRVHPMVNHASGPWVSQDTDRYGLPKTQVVAADSAGRRVSSLGTAAGSWFVDVWDIAEGRLLETRDDFLGAGEPNLFTVAGQWVAVAHEDTVRLWDTESQTAGPSLTLPPGQWSSVAMDPRLGWFIAGGPEGLSVLDRVDGTGTWQALQLDGAVVQCAASPSGTWCAAVTQESGLWIWDRGSGRVNPVARLADDFTVKAVSPAADWLVATRPGGDHVELIDRRDGARLSAIDGSLGWVSAVEVSARGDKLVTIQDQNRVTAVWDVHDPRSPRLISTHSPHDNQVTMARLSHRGDLLLIGYQGGRVLHR